MTKLSEARKRWSVLGKYLDGQYLVATAVAVDSGKENEMLIIPYLKKSSLTDVLDAGDIIESVVVDGVGIYVDCESMDSEVLGKLLTAFDKKLDIIKGNVDVSKVVLDTDSCELCRISVAYDYLTDSDKKLIQKNPIYVNEKGIIIMSEGLVDRYDSYNHQVVDATVFISFTAEVWKNE